MKQIVIHKSVLDCLNRLFIWRLLTLPILTNKLKAFLQLGFLQVYEQKWII